jgi:hypothetical protein
MIDFLPLPLKLSASETVEPASGWLDLRTQAKAKIIPKKTSKKQALPKNNVCIMFFKRYQFLRSQAIIFKKKEKGKHPKL